MRRNSFIGIFILAAVVIIYSFISFFGNHGQTTSFFPEASPTGEISEAAESTPVSDLSDSNGVVPTDYVVSTAATDEPVVIPTRIAPTVVVAPDNGSETGTDGNTPDSVKPEDIVTGIQTDITKRTDLNYDLIDWNVFVNSIYFKKPDNLSWCYDSGNDDGIKYCLVSVYTIENHPSSGDFEVEYDEDNALAGFRLNQQIIGDSSNISDIGYYSKLSAGMLELIFVDNENVVYPNEEEAVEKVCNEFFTVYLPEQVRLPLSLTYKFPAYDLNLYASDTHFITEIKFRK